MRTPAALPTVPLEETIDASRRIVVRQSRDWIEMLDFEAPNRYALLTERGELAGMAAEYPGGGKGQLSRWFLRSRRPFEMGIYAAGESRYPLLVLRRPWTWWLSRLVVEDADGKTLGIVKQRFTFVRRRFDVESPDGRVLARIRGPILHPWTFVLETPGVGRELGRIEKKWSGMTSEVFTNADTFLVTLPQTDPVLKRLAIGAAVLVDFLFFEDRD
jgi:uncharacterized protein YxjI